MSQFPCIYCDAPIPTSEAARTSLCPVCSRPLVGVRAISAPIALVEERARPRVRGDARARRASGLGQDRARAERRRLVGAERVRARGARAAGHQEPGAAADSRLGARRAGAADPGARALRGRHAGGAARAGAGQGAFEELLSLLSMLHTQSPPILHRDIRPENILFRSAKDWSPVLVDFVPAGQATMDGPICARSAPRCRAAARWRRSWRRAALPARTKRCARCTTRCAAGSRCAAGPRRRTQPAKSRRRSWLLAWVMFAAVPRRRMISAQLTRSSKHGARGRRKQRRLDGGRLPPAVRPR